MATWSGRGQGTCPKCSTTYSSRWKPANCPKCGFELGGSASVAKAQMCCPPAVNICGALYSIRTSLRDNRCLVYSENNLWICLHSDCKDVWAAYVSSDRAMEFTCQQIKQVPDSVRILDMYNLTAAKIAAYPCDAPTKSILYNISIPLGREAVYKVSDRTYVVYGPPSATNTLGFCHIKVENTKKAGTAFHKCSCKGFVSKAKQEKSRALCVHLHVLFCSLELYTHGDSDLATASTAPARDTSFSTFTPGITSNMPTKSLEAPSSSQQDPNNSHTASPETPSVSRLSTLNIYNSFRHERDSILYTNLNPFKDVVVKVKECTSVECRAMHRVCPSEEGIIIIFVFTLIKLISFQIAYNFIQNNHMILYCCIHGVVRLVDIVSFFLRGVINYFGLKKIFSLQTFAINWADERILKLRLSLSQRWYFCHLGLFNICDKLLVAIDILLEWRELFKRGCPISSFIEAKSEQLVLKLNKVIFKFP